MNIASILRDQDATLAYFQRLAAPYPCHWFTAPDPYDTTVHAVAVGEDFVWEIAIYDDGSYDAREAGIPAWSEGIEADEEGDS